MRPRRGGEVIIQWRRHWAHKKPPPDAAHVGQGTPTRRSEEGRKTFTESPMVRSSVMHLSVRRLRHGGARARRPSVQGALSDILHEVSIM